MVVNEKTGEGRGGKKERKEKKLVRSRDPRTTIDPVSLDVESWGATVARVGNHGNFYKSLSEFGEKYFSGRREGKTASGSVLDRHASFQARSCVAVQR